MLVVGYTGLMVGTFDQLLTCSPVIYTLKTGHLSAVTTVPLLVQFIS